MPKDRAGNRAAFSMGPPRVRLSTLDVEILAYLKDCIKFAPDHMRFKQTISSHLKNSQHKTCRFEDVDRRLRRLWKLYKPRGADTDDYESIYHHGIEVLFHIQDEPVLDRIRKRAGEIRSQYLDQRRKVMTRITRSNHSGYSHISLGTDFGGIIPRRAGRKIEISTPASWPQQIHIREHGDLEISLDTDEIFHDVQSSRSSPVARVPSDGDGRQSPSSQAYAARYDDKNLGSPSSGGNTASMRETSAASSNVERLVSSQTDASAATLSEEAPARWLESINDLKRQVADAKREAKYYAKELSSLSERSTKLQPLLESREDGTPMQKTSDEVSNARRLVRYQDEVRDLEAKLQNRTDLGHFTNQRRKCPIGPEYGQVEKDMDLIESSILDLLTCPETMQNCATADPSSQGEELLGLYHEAFCRSGTTWPPVPFQSILRALTSVAVCKWVFEPDFDEPYFANNHRGETMLKQLETQDGLSAARNLDFATLTKLIASYHCQNVVLPNRALDLAQRLWRTLTPLIRAQGRQSRWPSRVLKKWEKETNKRTSLFKAALRIKMATLVADWVYEVVLPSSGDQYDDVLMRKEGNNSPTSSVQLVLAPGLCRYQQEHTSVGCNGFRLPRSRDQRDFDPVRKALVRLG